MSEAGTLFEQSIIGRIITDYKWAIEHIPILNHIQNDDPTNSLLAKTIDFWNRTGTGVILDILFETFRTSLPTSEAEADTAMRAAAIHWINERAIRNSSTYSHVFMIKSRSTSPASSMTEFQNLSPISTDEDQTTNLDSRQAHEESDTYHSTVETAQAFLGRRETVENPLFATLLPDSSANIDNRRGDDTESVESSSDSTTWTLNAQCGSDESNDAPMEDDRETIPDEELVLRPESISCATRCGDTWMFKVKYEDSLLAREFFGQLLFSNPMVSDLAMEAIFDGVICRLRWWPEWIPIGALALTNPYSDLVRRLNALTSMDEEVRWDAYDCVYTVNGTGEGHHLCLSPCCAECAVRDLLADIENADTCRSPHLILADAGCRK